MSELNGYAEVQPPDVPAVHTNSLAVLDEQEIELITLANQYRGFTIAGIDDKDGYKKAEEARLILKRRRNKVENDAESLRAGAVKFSKAVIAREKQLVAIIAPVEKDLAAKVDAIDQEKERIRIENEKKENERIQARVNAMWAFGYALDLYDARLMSDEDYQALYEKEEAEFKIKQERIAAEKAEEERKRKAEEERLRIEREELDRQREEFNRREAELKALRDKELAEQRQREAQIKAEQERKENELRAEREKLEAEKRELERQKELKAAEERARVEAEQKAIREAEEKAEAERKAKEQAERELALKPDKERIFQYADALLAVAFPPGEYHPDSLSMLNWAKDQVKQLSAAIKENTNAL